MPNDQFTRVCFYVVAHADDWQIFMNPNVYNDLVEPYTRVVFIVTTAGDAGAAKSYWSAREEGTKSSIRFCLSPISTLTESSGTSIFNHHTVTHWSTIKAICYFFRLPDGNLDGNGFTVYNNQSLSRLRQGQISSITALDNCAIYNSWEDFCSTVQTIVQFESDGKPGTCINYINPDTEINTNDHADHIATGQAIQDMTITSTLRQVLFIGYSIRNTNRNLSLKDLFWKAGMFATYEKAVYDGSGYSTLKESVPTYVEWCLRESEFILINP